jgi:hypothetical protein
MKMDKITPIIATTKPDQPIIGETSPIQLNRIITVPEIHNNTQIV